jgi:hypothetical protein
MTIEGLAAEASIHTTYLSGIERGKHSPTWEVVGGVAAALGVLIADLEHLAYEQAGLEGDTPLRPERD